MVPGCFYRESEQVRESKFPIEHVDFDFLPYPARDYLETTITAEGINISSPRVQSSRGCVSSCSYCVESFRFFLKLSGYGKLEAKSGGYANGLFRVPFCQSAQAGITMGD